MMRYFCLILLFVILSIPTFAEDDPDIKQVARFGRGTAYTLAWRPDGKVLAVGSATGVWFFDEEFNELGRLAEDTPVNSLEWSPDGTRLITVKNSYQTGNCNLIVWNVNLDVQTSSQDKVFDYCAETVDWSSDSKLIAIGVEKLHDENTKILIVAAKDYSIQEQYNGLGSSATFSPDDDRLAISYDLDSRNLNIVDMATGNIEQIQVGGIEFVFDSRWSSDGRFLVVGCNNVIENWDFWGDCIWDIEKSAILYGEQLSRFTWHPTENWFVSHGKSAWGGSDQTSWLNLHTDLNSNRAFEKWHQDTIRRIDWHPSGNYFTALTVGQRLVDFNSLTGEVLEIQELFSSPISTLLWNPHNTNLLTASGTFVSLWNWYDEQNHLVQPNLHMQTKVGSNSITTTELRWYAENQILTMSTTIAGGRFAFHHTLRDSETSNVLESLLRREGDIGYYGDSGSFPTAKWSSDLTHVVYSQWDNPLQFHIAGELFTEDETIDFEVSVDHIRQIEWSPDNSMIATAGTVGAIDVNFFLIEIWDSTTGEVLSTMGLEWLQHYNRFIWNPDNKSIAVLVNRPTGSGCDLSVNIYTIPFGEVYQPVPSIRADFQAYERGANIDATYPYCYVPKATWSPDGKLIAVSFGNGVRIYNPSKMTRVAEISVDKMTSLDWHENGNYLAGGASDGTIYVWDVSVLMEG